MNTSGYSGVQPLHITFEDIPKARYLLNPTSKSLDFIHLFCTNKTDFEAQSLELKQTLKMTGMMWVSWPKGNSNLETDL